MSDLRNKLIKLAHDRPELRPHLLPMLSKTAGIPRGSISIETKKRLEKNAEEALTEIHEAIWDGFLTWTENSLSRLVADTPDEDIAMTAAYEIEKVMSSHLKEMRRDVGNLLGQVSTHGNSMYHEVSHFIVRADDERDLRSDVENAAKRSRVEVSDIIDEGGGKFRVVVEGDYAYDNAANMVGILARNYPDISKAFTGT